MSNTEERANTSNFPSCIYNWKPWPTKADIRKSGARISTQATERKSALSLSIYYDFDFFVIRQSPGDSECPNCKDKLTSNQIFPDNFAKREIMNLSLRCPNAKNGCEVLLDLHHIQVGIYVSRIEVSTVVFTAVLNRDVNTSFFCKPDFGCWKPISNRLFIWLAFIET